MNWDSPLHCRQEYIPYSSSYMTRLVSMDFCISHQFQECLYMFCDIVQQGCINSCRLISIYVFFSSGYLNQLCFHKQSIQQEACNWLRSCLAFWYRRDSILAMLETRVSRICWWILQKPFNTVNRERPAVILPIFFSDNFINSL